MTKINNPIIMKTKSQNNKSLFSKYIINKGNFNNISDRIQIINNYESYTYRLMRS